MLYLSKHFLKFTVYEPQKGCVLWRGPDSGQGYGGYFDGEQLHVAHRFAYQVQKGAIPEKYDVDHLCKNRRCVNPYHLEAVPHRVNTLRSDSVAGINARKTHCPAGHELAGENLAVVNGRRRCKTCVRQRQRTNYVPKPRAYVPRSHCKRGHEMNEQNTIINARGGRVCKACCYGWRKRKKLEAEHGPAGA